ncbi:MAG: DUF2141 domain-containing protein [Gammaproteobacteria bacterium]
MTRFSPPETWQSKMRLSAVLLFGLAAVATAEAQSEPARFGFLPMPHSMPTLLFAPDPLSGTLLRPLAGPAADADVLPEVPLEVMPVAAVDALPEVVPEAQPVEAAEPLQANAAPLPEATEATVSAIPEAPLEPAPAATAPSGSTVTVIVENVESGSGTVNVAMCDKGLSREGCPYIREVPAQAGFVETEFQDIPPGTYAVVGYHDVNGNDIFDKIFGMPREPYALSNSASDKLVPTFDDAAMRIQSGENAVIIRLTRLGG